MTFAQPIAKLANMMHRVITLLWIRILKVLMHVYIQLCLCHCTFLSVNITLQHICMYLANKIAVNTYYSKATLL